MEVIHHTQMMVGEHQPHKYYIIIMMVRRLGWDVGGKVSAGKLIKHLEKK